MRTVFGVAATSAECESARKKLPATAFGNSVLARDDFVGKIALMNIGYKAVVGWAIFSCLVEVGCGGDDDSTGGAGGSSGHGGAGATAGSGAHGGAGAMAGSGGHGGSSGGTAGTGNTAGVGGSSGGAKGGAGGTKGGTAGIEGGSGGTSAGQGGKGGTAGHGGAGGSTGGAAGGGAAGAGEGGSGGMPQTSCDELIAEYNQELVNAKKCDPSASAAQCQKRVSNALGCESACDTVVNTATTLNDLAAQFSDQGCPPPTCPAIACMATELGICSGATTDGTCQDHS